MEQENKVEEKKCTKCDKMKQKIAPHVILGMSIFGFTIYGMVEFVRNIIELLSH
jgi:hypothetical protein